MTNRAGRSIGHGARRGAGLVEIVLAMVIFAFIATSYAAISLRYATRMKTVSAGAARSAALQEYMARLSSVPFDSLANRAGTFTTTTGSFPNSRSIIVSGSGTTRSVTLILTPTNTAIKPDTVTMTRVKSITSNPLGT
jgi:type II secretory pathway component PulJ